MYGPSTCTELNEIGGSLGGEGLFSAVCFSVLGDPVGLGVASVEWTGLARLTGGAGWAESATVKVKVAVQHNSKRQLTMSVKVRKKRVYVAEAGEYATGLIACCRCG